MCSVSSQRNGIYCVFSVLVELVICVFVYIIEKTTQNKGEVNIYVYHIEIRRKQLLYSQKKLELSLVFAISIDFEEIYEFYLDKIAHGFCFSRNVFFV